MNYYSIVLLNVSKGFAFIAFLVVVNYLRLWSSSRIMESKVTIFDYVLNETGMTILVGHEL